MIVFEGDALDTIQAAIKAFGEEAQQYKAIEELGELIVALTHYRKGSAKRGDVITEIADVLVMAAQLREMFGASRVDSQVLMKLERLRMKLEDKHG